MIGQTNGGVTAATTSMPATAPIAPGPAVPSDWSAPASAEAHRDVLVAVQRSLRARWQNDLPRVAVVERDGHATVYVSTLAALKPSARTDIRSAVRAAMIPYVRLAPSTNVVFLTRGPR